MLENLRRIDNAQVKHDVVNKFGQLVKAVGGVTRLNTSTPQPCELELYISPSYDAEATQPLPMDTKVLFWDGTNLTPINLEAYNIDPNPTGALTTPLPEIPEQPF